MKCSTNLGRRKASAGNPKSIHLDWEGEVTLVERLGHDTILYVSVPDAVALTVSLDGQHAQNDGDTVHLRPQSVLIHKFNEQSRPESVRYGMNSKRPTVKVVARDAGVSIATVNCAMLRPDDVLGGRLAAGHLIELRHSDIVQVSGSLQTCGFEHRYHGSSQKLKNASIPLQRERELFGSHSVNNELEATKKLLASNALPTAVFVHHEKTATELLHGLVGAGVRVPVGILVIGYNDMPYAAIFSPGPSSTLVPGAPRLPNTRRNTERRGCRRSTRCHRARACPPRQHSTTSKKHLTGEPRS